MFLVFGIFIFMVIVQTLTPYFTRKTTVFGVSIPEPYVQHPQLATFKKQYSQWIGGIGAVLTLLQLILLLMRMQEETFLLLSFTFHYVLLILVSALYMVYHSKTKRLKRMGQWEAHVKPVHVMDMSLRAKTETLPLIFFILPMIITLALIAFTYMNYKSIPDVFAMHWNAKGEVDGWTDKTWLSVIALPLILLGTQMTFLLMGIGMQAAKIQLSVQDKASSVQRELYQRKYGSWYLVVINFALTILLTFLHYTTTILHDETISYFWLFLIGFILITFGGLILLIWRLSTSNERFDKVPTNETAVGDDQYWRWGIFYINKDDPALLVQKKYGIGWTINFGNKWSYIIILLSLLPILVIILI